MTDDSTRSLSRHDDSGNHDDSGSKGLAEPIAGRDPLPVRRWRPELQFEQLVAGVRDFAIILLDAEGRVQSWNLGADRLYGYRAEEIIGECFSRFYPAEAARSGWPDAELKVAASEGRFEDDGWRIRKDGSRFWVNAVITALRAADGTCWGFLKLTRDLTERRQADEALRQSEERFRLLVDNVVDYAILMLDVDGKIATWNIGAERIKGYTAQEVIGRHISLFYPEEAVRSGWPQHELKIAAAEGRYEEEGWRLRKDGSRFWANVVITAVHDQDGRLSGFSKVTRDLTERKRVEDELQQSHSLLEQRVEQRTAELQQANAALTAENEERKRAEQALRESEERYRRLIYAMPAAVYVTDREGRITLFNEEAAALWGRRPEIGKELWCGSFRIFRSDGTPLPHDECPMAITLREGRPVRGQTIFVERPDGVRVCILPHPEPLRNSSGQVVGAINMLVDITELRRLHEQLRANADKLAAADRRKDEFLALLGHELRNPLAVIANAIELLSRQGDANRQTAEITALAARQVSQIRHLLDDLLDITRVSRGKIALRTQRIDLRQVLQDSAADQQAASTLADCRLDVQIGDEPLWVEGDPTRLAQVFGNLLHNACKFSNPGGCVTLTAAREPNGAFAHVAVRDAGIGMTEETRKSIFVPFTQAETSLDRSRGGLGLGLALVKGLVELHGGSVSAHSDGLGKGSEFSVRLPLVAPGEAASRTGDGTAQTPSAPRFRILLVEDSVPVARIFSVMLEEMGHTVRTVSSGAAALEQVAVEVPDVVFSDISMPGMSGYELARRLREIPGGERLFLVAMTGYGQSEDRVRALEAGFDEHLVKPASFAELQALFERIPKPSAPTH